MSLKPGDLVCCKYDKKQFFIVLNYEDRRMPGRHTVRVIDQGYRTNNRYSNTLIIIPGNNNEKD